MDKNISLKIEKGYLLLITKPEFEKFAAENRFSSALKESILRIANKWFAGGVAAILYFLNHLQFDYSCDCFLPIFENKDALLKAPIPQAENGILCLRPYIGTDILSENGKNIDNLLYQIYRNSGNWTKEYVFGIGGDMPIRKINLNPYAEHPDSYITKKLLDSLGEDLRIYTDLAKVRPEFQPYVYELVRDIEQVRKELDVKEGFTKLQMQAHDFAIRLPTESAERRPTVFDGSFFKNIKEFMDSCIEAGMDFFKEDFCLGITAVAYGSSTLLIDIIPTPVKHPAEENERIVKDTQKAKDFVKKIVKATPVLVNKSNASDTEKIDAFLEETKLEPEKARNIITKMDKLFPANKSIYKNINLYVQTDKQDVVKFEKQNYTSFGNVKRTIIEQTREDFEANLSGLLGVVEVWDKTKPKFKIKTDTGKLKTIHYQATAKNEENVKKNIGKNVSIEVAKMNKSNFLVKWL